MLTTNDSPGALPREMMKHTYPVLYEVEESHWWHIGRRRIIGSFVKEICDQTTDHHPQTPAVACGRGPKLKMLAQFGYAQGDDCSPDAAASSPRHGRAKSTHAPPRTLTTTA